MDDDDDDNAKMALPPKKGAPRWRGERKIGFSAVLGIWSRSVAVCEFAHFGEVENQSRTIVVGRLLRNVSIFSLETVSLRQCLNQSEKCVGEICGGLDGFANTNQTAAWSSLWSILRATHNPRKRDLARWDDSLLCSLYPAFQLCAASNIYQRKFPLQLSSNINRANSSPSWI